MQGAAEKQKRRDPYLFLHTDKSRHFRWSQDKIHDVDTIPHRCADYSPIAAEPAAPEISLLFSRSLLTYGIIADSSGFFKGGSEFFLKNSRSRDGTASACSICGFYFFMPLPIPGGLTKSAAGGIISRVTRYL